MCGLAHDLEGHGLPTTAIGLIERHVALIAPPRALVVPFELGRPYGAPDVPDFQRRVLACALELLARLDGTVLERFPDRAPEPAEGLPPWSPPFAAAAAPASDDPTALAEAVRAELAQMRPAYDAWVGRGGRRLDRVSGLEHERIVDLILDYVRDPSMDGPVPGYPSELGVKFAADDLKHAYYQAALARPARVTDVEVDDWFFGRTAAGRLMFALKAALLAEGTEAQRGFAGHAFIPSHQAHRADG